jgi:glycosyltransferase involved in cell wall biosynthesis
VNGTSRRYPALPVSTVKQPGTSRAHHPDEEALRILFVCQNDFAAPSEKQVLGFAQQLTRRGHQVMVSIAGDLDTAEREGALAVSGLIVHRHQFRRGRLRADDLDVARRFRPSLVHAWNSRVSTVAAARTICRATGAPLFVHFEDDEWRLPDHPPGESLRRRVGHLGRRLLSNVDPSVWWHSTWRSRRYVARRAIALDALTPALAEEVKRRMGRACRVVLPVTPEPISMPQPTEAPELGAGPPVLLITGTIWPVYLPDFMLAFQAIAELQRRGRQLRLVHAGRVLPRWRPEDLTAQAGMSPGSATFLGYLPFAAIPALLCRADLLLQPGPPSEFNRLRLPSKLQAYLESGTPTITFGVGFGELLEDRVEVSKTHSGDPGELADRIAELLDDDVLRATLARGGPHAAHRLFDPDANTLSLLAHYREGLRCGTARR